ncbi:hypothetical protein Aspvir_006253 [Aspergillus viridinutans]|uniref:Uncharacterized protein n=1 Tax=Aspergillus viridinutans TaxID=75553 RepID=A0A9P3BTV0_ASPVI|nr:uncharacterized protein Aspvir_006253 [Aspergillus viridinutans]GIK02205.1 hypothetical protein Aspvir_006253 [Aspergillus viridinutans]
MSLNHRTSLTVSSTMKIFANVLDDNVLVSSIVVGFKSHDMLGSITLTFGVYESLSFHEVTLVRRIAFIVEMGIKLIRRHCSSGICSSGRTASLDLVAVADLAVKNAQAVHVSFEIDPINAVGLVGDAWGDVGIGSEDVREGGQDLLAFLPCVGHLEDVGL